MRVQIKGLEGFSPEEQAEVKQLLIKLHSLPRTIPQEGTDDRDIFSSNGDPYMAELENGFYRELAEAQRRNLIDLIHHLGFKIPLEKQGDKLQKGMGDALKKFMKQSGTVTAAQLKEIDAILNRKLPEWAKVAEKYMLRTGLLSKIKAKLGGVTSEVLKAMGFYLDQLPETIKSTTNKRIVLTLQEKDRAFANGDYEVKVLPLLPQEVDAVRVASLRAASKVTEVADRVKNRIRILVTQALDERWEPKKLEQALFDELGHLNRDWRRVAITELAMAQNDAYLMSLPDGSTVTVPSIAGACRHCVALLEGKTFTVLHEQPAQLTYDIEMNTLWPGKTNQGRKVSEWLPCIPLHPNCRHRATVMSKFYKMGSDGVPKLKTSIELIQEERLRRGLPPDPDIAKRLAQLHKEWDDKE